MPQDPTKPMRERTRAIIAVDRAELAVDASRQVALEYARNPHAPLRFVWADFLGDLHALAKARTRLSTIIREMGR